MHFAGPIDASNDEDGDELQSDNESDADQHQPARVQSASDDSEVESQKPKKQTAQKGRMTRLYRSVPPANAAQPPRNRKQQQIDDFIKGFGETLSTTAAASDRAALERHRETRRSLLYQVELKAYMAEKKQMLECNKMVLQQHKEERDYAREHGVPCGPLMDFAPEPIRPIAPVMGGAQAAGPSSHIYGRSTNVQSATSSGQMQA